MKMKRKKAAYERSESEKVKMCACVMLCIWHIFGNISSFPSQKIYAGTSEPSNNAMVM